MARSHGDTDQRNGARLSPGCRLAIDQRRLTNGDYNLLAMACDEPEANRMISATQFRQSACLRRNLQLQAQPFEFALLKSQIPKNNRSTACQGRFASAGV